MRKICSTPFRRLFWAATFGVGLTASAGAGEKTITLPDNSEVKALYGHVTVPLRRDIESDRALFIPYIRLLALADSNKPPVIVLESGPTWPGTEALADDQLGTLLNDLLLTRDVVFLDQRGTGDGRDVLDCYELHDFPLVPAPSTVELQTVANRFAANCAASLRARGTDLAAYNINESADDIADVARHLGTKKVALFGSSHGSILALNVIRRHESLVDRALLAAVPSTESAFKSPHQLDDVLLALDELAADPKSHWPLGESPSFAVHKALRAFDEPRRISYTDIYDRKIEIEVSRRDATEHLFRWMGTRASWENLPVRLVELNRTDGLEELARETKERRRYVGNSTLTIASRCMMWAKESRLQQIEQQKKTSVARDLLVFPAPDVCKSWDVEPLPADLLAPLRNDVPVLMVSGDIDYKTPIAESDKIAASLRNSVQIKVANMGHQFVAAYEGMSAVRGAVLDFMNGKRVDDAQHSLSFKFDELD